MPKNDQTTTQLHSPHMLVKVKSLSHVQLFENFTQFIVSHTVKGISIVNEAEVDVSLEFSCFFHDPVDAGNLISGSFAFLKPA